jgi:hypothetical protein
MTVDATRPASEGDPDRLVTVHEATSEFEGRSIVALLEDAGIAAFVFPLADLPLADALRGRRRVVRVQAAARDAERARSIVAERTRDAESIDWDEVDVGEATEEVEELAAAPLEATAARGLARLGRWAAWGIVLLILATGAVATLAALLSGR